MIKFAKPEQKHTSYGANEIRDGICYTEQERKKLLITANDLATLENLECFVGLPEPEVRIARIKLPLVKVHPENNIGYVPIESISEFNELRPEPVEPLTGNECEIDINNDINLLHELDEIEALEFDHSLNKGI